MFKNVFLQKTYTIIHPQQSKSCPTFLFIYIIHIDKEIEIRKKKSFGVLRIFFIITIVA